MSATHFSLNEWGQHYSYQTLYDLIYCHSINCRLYLVLILFLFLLTPDPLLTTTSNDTEFFCVCKMSLYINYEFVSFFSHYLFTFAFIFVYLWKFVIFQYFLASSPLDNVSASSNVEELWPIYKVINILISPP